MTNQKIINLINSEIFFDDMDDVLGSLQFYREYREYDSKHFKKIVFDQDLLKLYSDNIKNNDNENWDFEEIIWGKLIGCQACVIPREYDEVIAFKCGLIPFGTINEKNTGNSYLILEESNIDLSPRLDAYQALTSGTINENSKLFKDRIYFEQVVGVELTNEVLAAIFQF